MEVVTIDVASAPQVNVAGMADLVKALLEGGHTALQDGAWLRERGDEVDLDPHESVALEALRVRLRDGLPLLNDGPPTPWY